ARGVQAYQHLAFLDEIAFAHEDLLDSAAFQVLHALAVARHLHGGVGRDAGVQRRKRRPAGKPAKAENEHHQAPAQRGPEIRVDTTAGQFQGAFFAPGVIGDRLLAKPAHVRLNSRMLSVPARWSPNFRLPWPAWPAAAADAAP